MEMEKIPMDWSRDSTPELAAGIAGMLGKDTPTIKG